MPTPIQLKLYREEHLDTQQHTNKFHTYNKIGRQHYLLIDSAVCKGVYYVSVCAYYIVCILTHIFVYIGTCGDLKVVQVQETKKLLESYCLFAFELGAAVSTLKDTSHQEKCVIQVSKNH